jgi:hypothetical protein
MSLLWLKREATGKARQAAANQGFMAPINGAPTVTNCPIKSYQAVKPSSFKLALKDRTKVARDMVPVGCKSPMTASDNSVGFEKGLHSFPFRNFSFYPSLSQGKDNFERKTSGIQCPSIVVWAVVEVFLTEDVSLLSPQ